MKKIIIDTDPGVDDAIAIAFGIKSSLPIESIACVYGNSTVENSIKNTLTILELAEVEIPVYKGAKKPLIGEAKLAEGHGDNGFGGFGIKFLKQTAKLSALEHYKEILSNSQPGELSIIAIGPTTNLGQLLKESPELFQKIGKIIIMGGVFGAVGNITPYAEFNVYNDPQSFRLLIESNHSELIVVPADVCRKVVFGKNVFDKINYSKLSNGLSKISQFYLNYYSNDKEFGGFRGGVMYDLLAVALHEHENIFQIKPCKVKVETEAGEKYGLTEITAGSSNCRLVTDVNSEKLTRLFIKTMSK